MTIVGNTAVIPIDGVLMKSKERVARMRRWGLRATSYHEIRDHLTSAMANADVKSILLDVSSPGGVVFGANDLAAEIHAANKKKPIVAFADELNASAAYFLSSQAGAMFASSDAEVGSIGTFLAIDDCSGLFEAEGIKTHVVRSGPHKGVGVIGAKITSEHLRALQENVNDFAQQFFAAVKRGRGGSIAKLDEVTNGDIWVAPRAKAKGIIDGIKSASQAMSAAESAGRQFEAEGKFGDPECNFTGFPIESDATGAAEDNDEEVQPDGGQMAEHDEGGGGTPTITAAALQAQHSEVYDAVYGAGVEAERKRIGAILERSKGVDAKIVNQAISEGWSTERAFGEFLGYVQERKEARLEDIRREQSEDNANGVDATDAPRDSARLRHVESSDDPDAQTDDKSPSDEQIEAMPEGEDRWKAEFAANYKGAADDFVTVEDYVAFRKHDRGKSTARRSA